MQMRSEFFTAFVSDGLSKDSFNIHFVKKISANLHLPLLNTERPWPIKVLSHARKYVPIQ